MSENDEDNGPAILGVAIATTVVAALCVFLRLYIRIWLISSFSWDDGLMAVALVRQPTLIDELNRLTSGL